MSKPLYVARVSAVACASNGAKTMIQVVTPSTVGLRVKEVGFSFDGTDATKTPVLVELLLQTTAGTSSALTLVKGGGQGARTALCSALQTFTAEPTASDVLLSEYVSPAGGFDRIQWPLDDEPELVVSTRLGLRVTTVTGSGTPNFTGYIRFEEV